MRHLPFPDPPFPAAAPSLLPVDLIHGVGTIGILLASNFMIAAETAKGRRPSLNNAALPDRGRVVFDQLVAVVRQLVPAQVVVETGEFGAMMKVELVNDGPVTFIVESGPGRDPALPQP